MRKIHTLKGPYCCIQGAGDLSEFLRAIWWGLNGHLDKSPRGKPLIDALLLQTTGNWPVYDIKSFAIGTFLSWLLLKEQMMISKIYIYICVSECEIAKQAGVLSKKSTGLRANIYKQLVFLLLLLLHRLTLIISPLPQNWQNFRLVSVQTFVKSAQYQSLFCDLPWLWTVYVIKVLDLVSFFSLSPNFFSFKIINNIQSWPIVYLKKWRSELH